MATVGQVLERLKKSPFRSKFHLSDSEKLYFIKHGEETIQEHAKAFVYNRLAPANIENDGKQTPMRGHPVFKAQHACACCCRGCLEKWYKVPQNIELSEKQQDMIVKLLMTWIKLEMQN